MRLKVDYTSRDAYLANQATNVSRGGAFIASSSPLPVDSEMDIFLTLPDRDERILARGRVIWHEDDSEGANGAGMGVKFLEMSPADSHALDQFLSRLPPAPTRTPGKK